MPLKKSAMRGVKLTYWSFFEGRFPSGAPPAPEG
jgi:hypothetical protein